MNYLSLTILSIQMLHVLIGTIMGPFCGRRSAAQKGISVGWI
jgi:hypothetical protein